MQELETKITISRPCNGSGKEYIHMTLYDEKSCIQFVSTKIELKEFMMALTGLGHVKCTTEVRGFENVGKTRERMKASVLISDEEYIAVTSKGKSYDDNKRVLGEWLIEKHGKEGWKVDTYLGSQGSVVYTNAGKMLNFSYYRYV